MKPFPVGLIMLKAVKWWDLRRGDVIQPMDDVVAVVACVDFDGAIWDTHGNRWRTYGTSVIVMEPANDAARETFDVVVHAHLRNKPVIGFEDQTWPR